jgi:hypothetical protein
MKTNSRGWSKRQIISIHHYATAAGLIIGSGKSQDKTAYVQFLRDHTFLGRPGFKTGAMTSKDARLTQDDFDIAMPVLEATLWQRVDAGHAAAPATSRGAPYARDYWARRCADPSRLRHAVQVKFRELMTLRPDIGPDYLDGIASRSTGGRLTAWQNATREQFPLIVNALEDLLRYARRRAA